MEIIKKIKLSKEEVETIIKMEEIRKNLEDGFELFFDYDSMPQFLFKVKNYTTKIKDKKCFNWEIDDDEEIEIDCSDYLNYDNQLK